MVRYDQRRGGTGIPSTDSLIASVERAFAIVRVIGEADRSIGVTEIARRSDLPKSTAARLLATLEHLEIVERVAARGRFRPGPALMTLGVGGPSGLRTRARPHIRRLVDQIDEDAGLAVADGDRILYIDQVSCDNPVQVPDWSGERLAYNTAAAGYLLMADMDEDRLNSLLVSGFPKRTAATVTDPDLVQKRVGRARRNGYAWARGDWYEDINGVAAPIVDATGAVVAALNVYGPAYRFPGDRAESEIEQMVIDTANAIGTSLRA